MASRIAQESIATDALYNAGVGSSGFSRSPNSDLPEKKASVPPLLRFESYVSRFRAIVPPQPRGGSADRLGTHAAGGRIAGQSRERSERKQSTGEQARSN